MQQLRTKLVPPLPAVTYQQEEEEEDKEEQSELKEEGTCKR